MRLRSDFWDNMLLVPGRSPPPAVAALCYYSAVEDCAGATHLSPTPDSALETMGAPPAPGGGSAATAVLPEHPPGAERNAWILSRANDFRPRWHQIGEDLWVAHDYFGIDGVRMPCDRPTSEQLAAEFGGRLPTRAEVDRIWAAAELQLSPLPWGPPYDASMRSVERFLEHSERIDAQLPDGNVARQLVAGHKKDVVSGAEAADKVAIYGWHHTNGAPIQPYNDTAHGSDYSDYSHGVRIVRDTAPTSEVSATVLGADGVETGAARVPHETGWLRDAAAMRRLYEAERPVRFKPGTCVLYCLDAFHRGTPVELGAWRYTQHTVWRRADAPHVGFQTLAPNLAYMPPRYLANMVPDCRAVLGIPPPGDTFWTPNSVEAARRRYGFDPGPYLRHLNAPRL